LLFQRQHREVAEREILELLFQLFNNARLLVVPPLGFAEGQILLCQFPEGEPFEAALLVLNVLSRVNGVPAFGQQGTGTAELL
jgi:hypothetical protein